MKLSKFVPKNRLSDAALVGSTLFLGVLCLQLKTIQDPCNLVGIPPITDAGGLTVEDCRRFIGAGLKAAGGKAGKAKQAELLYLIMGTGASVGARTRAARHARVGAS